MLIHTRPVKTRRTGLATALAMLVLAAPAEAALRFDRCGRGEAPCAGLRVPLDRGGAVPGTIALKVERWRPRRATRPPVVLLAGGPGQSARRAFSGALGLLDVPDRDVILMDQRGTGGSGALRCRDLQAANLANAERQAAACQALLGRRRHFYRTEDSVEDLEALRRALGASRLALVGVSYGTYLAQAYAARYPQHVERMVLDSVVDTGGVDPFNRDIIAASRRVLRALCRRACRTFTRDPVGDVARLVERLARGSGRGFVVDELGVRRPAAIDRQGLFGTLVASDMDDLTRAELPAAVVSALRGDSAPLLRLHRRAIAPETTDPRDFSAGAFAAAMCEEVRFPWPRSMPPGERGAAAWAAAGLLGPGVLMPFDAATVSGSDLNRLCRRWIAAPEPPPPVGALPDVPTLIFAGGRDLRTPLENARLVASRLPGATMVVVPDAGHSVISSASCARRIYKRFLGDRRIGSRCPAGADLAFGLPPSEPAPTSLRDLHPVRGVEGRVGRAVAAFEATLLDYSYQLFALRIVTPAQRRALRGVGLAVPGLRGGRALFSVGPRGALRLQSFEYVPGVRVSGGVGFGRRSVGRFRIHGPGTPDGRIFVDERGRVRGIVGGRRVRLRMMQAGSAAARVSRTPCPRIMRGWRGRSSLSLLPARLCLPRRIPPAPR
jgi:pimeloyl-ACP methyl ester carboxylesterase